MANLLLSRSLVCIGSRASRSGDLCEVVKSVLVLKVLSDRGRGARIWITLNIVLFGTGRASVLAIDHGVEGARLRRRS